MDRRRRPVGTEICEEYLSRGLYVTARPAYPARLCSPVPRVVRTSDYCLCEFEHQLKLTREQFLPEPRLDLTAPG